MPGYKFDHLRVLIVDDNVHMRKMLSAIIRAFGVVAVHEAANGVQAWEKLRTMQADLVFVDWMMPEMSGLELVKLVRTSPESPNPFLPMIMLTGHTQVEHVHQARDAGITDFMAKPISAKGVLARLTAVIENPRSFVRTAEYFGPCRRRRRSEEYLGPERRSASPPTDPSNKSPDSAEHREHA